MSHEEEARIVGHVLQSSRMGELNVTSFFIKCELPNKGAIFEIHNGLVEHSKTEADPKRFAAGLVITFRFHKLSAQGLPDNAVFVRFCPALTWEEVNARAKSRTPFSQSLKPSQIARIKGIAPSTPFSSEPAISSGDEGLSDDESLTPYVIPKIAVKHALLKSPASSSSTSSSSTLSVSSEWTIDDDSRVTKKPKLPLHSSISLPPSSSESQRTPLKTTPSKLSPSSTESQRTTTPLKTTPLKTTPRKTPPFVDEDKSVGDAKITCKYGASCYQTNPYHLENFFHPTGTEVEENALPLCKYGPACYRTNPEHRLQFSH